MNGTTSVPSKCLATGLAMKQTPSLLQHRLLQPQLSALSQPRLMEAHSEKVIPILGNNHNTEAPHVMLVPASFHSKPTTFRIVPISVRVGVFQVVLQEVSKWLDWITAVTQTSAPASLRVVVQTCKILFKRLMKIWHAILLVTLV